MTPKPYVGRGGHKLKFAIDQIDLDLEGKLGADFGCNIGGFTDCMLQEGARRVYAVDTGYGMLEWKLRIDDRVEVMERTNAMHVDLPEKPDIITIDVAWTRQRYILPNALHLVAGGGCILSLFKPQYEADDELVHDGVVAPENFNRVLEDTLSELKEMGIEVQEVIRLPHEKKSKNPEAILYIRPEECTDVPLPG
jgi:23S rRNA (cytidine1920-2'-O)/16S rRNA (cytidine1409-2'-O)-methyltransferase